MDSFNTGTLAGAGSFRCATCDFAVALQERDAVPECPACGGSEFQRAPLFGGPGASPTPGGGERPEWLPEARGALNAGDYVAFELDDRVRVLPLTDGWTRIGRSLSADIRIDDPTVSRRHALVYRDDEGARVLDDRSLNGVFRNGEQVDLSELEDGDTLTVGRFVLHFLSLSCEEAENLEVVSSW